jgi:hypothetical protein
MPNKPTYDWEKLAAVARSFFSSDQRKQMLPDFQGVEIWLTSNGEWFWVIFFLTAESFRRFHEYQDKGWNPFPGLFSPDESGSAAIAVHGEYGFYDSNMTQNGYAFLAGRDGSFIIHNHRHSTTDAKGNTADYLVDLAFVVGIDILARYENSEEAFIHLFEHFEKVWSSKR